MQCQQFKVVLLYAEVAQWTVLGFSPGDRTVRFIRVDRRDFDPLSFSAASTIALHSLTLD